MTFDLPFALRILPVLVEALVVTIAATAAGMALALSLGLGWAILRRSGTVAVSRSTQMIVEFIRSTPLLVQIYFLFYVLPRFGITLSPFVTGAAALGLHYSAYASEVYRAGIESIPRGQWEAAGALNLSRPAIWLRVVMPQAVRVVLPALANYAIAMFKDTPLLSAITVLELLQTAKIIGAESFRYLEPFTLVGVLFLTLSLATAGLSAGLERKLAIPGGRP